MTDWSERFNALPTDVRRICAVVEAQMRIQQLKMERARLIARHRQSLAEVDDHVRNIQKWIGDQCDAAPHEPLSKESP